MRKADLLCLGLAIMGFGCTDQLTGPSTDTQAVENAARRFVDLAHEFEYAALREAITSDFEILFDGQRWNFEDFEIFLHEIEESLGGEKLGSYTYLDIDTKIVGDVAYISWASANWLESMTFVWSGDEWLADRAVSVPVKNNEL